MCSNQSLNTLAAISSFPIDPSQFERYVSACFTSGCWVALSGNAAKMYRVASRAWGETTSSWYFFMSSTPTGECDSSSSLIRMIREGGSHMFDMYTEKSAETLLLAVAMNPHFGFWKCGTCAAGTNAFQI